jgi:hypothetical protein
LKLKTDGFSGSPMRVYGISMATLLTQLIVIVFSIAVILYLTIGLQKSMAKESEDL